MLLSSRIRIVCFIALTAIISVSSAPAQKRTEARRASRPAQKPPDSASKFDTQPFDRRREDLPPHYIGNSYIDLIAALSKRQRIAGKGEFESTIDYRARMERINSQPLSGGITFNSILAFTVNQYDEQLEVKYDADLTVLDAVLKWQSSYLVSGAKYTLKWFESSEHVTNYVGRTAFGARKRVQVYRNADYYIGANWNKGNGRSLSSYDAPPEASTSIFMPPSEARIAKGNLRALLVCRLAEQPVFTDSDRDTPEITDPYDRFNFTYAVIVVPLEVWFYDLPTGRVYAKLSYESDGEEAAPIGEDKSPIDYSRVFSPKEVNVKARILSRPEPQYPEEARAKQVSGTVVLRGVFRADGQVTDIRVISGLPYGINERAIDAAKQIRFTPAMKNGRAVSQYIQIEYNFNLY
jgi:TonB family protein